MRWLVFIALSFSALAFAQEPSSSTSPGHSPQPRNQLPTPTAEPENTSAYAPAAPREDEGPSAADRGPAQQHFILATMPDHLADEENPPTVNNAPPDKIALDKRVRIDKIHDVEDDSNYKGGENHALLYELTYLNWGAVTGEQLDARRGHYFTISWENRGPRDNFTVCFQYREAISQGIVRTLKQPMTAVHGTVRSYFAVVGKAFKAYGPVSSWRLTILKGDTVVAETRSYIW